MSFLSVPDAIAVAVLVGGGVGFVVRWQDRRQEARRLEVESRAADARLRADTAIRAVGLLDASERHAGALLALAELGQVAFAVDMLREVWPRDAITTSGALWIIDLAFRADDSELQIQAAGVLSANARRLAADGTLLFPRDISARWPTELARAARLKLVASYAEAGAAVPDERRTRVWPHLALVAHAAMKQDPDVLVRRDAGLWLETVLHRLQRPDEHGFTDVEGTTHRVGDLRAAAEGVRLAGGPSPTLEIWDAMEGYRDLDIAARWAFPGASPE